MKSYRVSILDFSTRNGKVISQKVVKGLSSARAILPVKVHYCRNAKGFVGYKDSREYWIFET